MDSILSTASHASPLSQMLLFVYRLLGAHLGIDPSIILTTLGFIWGISKLFTQLYNYFIAFVNTYFMCSMNVSEDDRIYEHLMKWMAQHPSIVRNKDLTAQTVWKSAWDEDDNEEEEAKALFWTDGGDDDGTEHKYLNFSNQAARSTPRFVPAMGSSGFWHRGTYFKVFRARESFAGSRGWGLMRDIEQLTVSCYGRSIEPIKQLLLDSKMLFYADTSQRTTIYRPRAKEMRRDYNMWQQVARRPVRPMRTVVLDAKEKHAVLSDVNEYLHPSTPRWYASRGIPLRRGYLFHGPPGTGKTSFSFALAGVFGIDIYVISLQDASVTEEDLAVLFTKLPRRCVVLLEDIDTAGLRRDPDTSADAEKGEDESTKKQAEAQKEKEKAVAKKKAKERAKNKSKKSKKAAVNGSSKKSSKSTVDADLDSDSDDSSSSSSSSDSDSDESVEEVTSKSKGKRDGARKSRQSKKAISLSGLLNAIDGVASHEGRILIMTTNKPESLDEALVRPGRVDVQVGFGNASCYQAEELFLRMYEVASRSQKTRDQVSGTGSSKQDANGVLAKQARQAYGLDVDETEMKRLAKEFGKKVPASVFSPAELQGFLLKRKKSPLTALEELDAWIEGTLKQKEAKSKVTLVQ